MNKNERKGFTLAEVLITLSIIGIVAAITIPALINNYQKKQFAVGAQKGYAEFSQALKLAAIDNGDPDDISKSVMGLYWTQEPLAIIKQLKVVKNCEWDLPPNDCGDANFDLDAGDYRFITADGMSFDMGYGAGCNTNYGINADSPTKNVCTELIIDSNGLKGPNALGRDRLVWYITSSPKHGVMLYPTGGFEDNKWGTYPAAVGENYWNSGGRNYSLTQNHWYCAGRIMEKGWTMDY